MAKLQCQRLQLAQSAPKVRTARHSQNQPLKATSITKYIQLKLTIRSRGSRRQYMAYRIER